MKLNLGCTSRILEGYINIDLDSIEQIRVRYPNIAIPQSASFVQGDIFSLEYPDSSVDEIRADALVEHLDFKEEPFFLRRFIAYSNLVGTSCLRPQISSGPSRPG